MRGNDKVTRDSPWEEELGEPPSDNLHRSGGIALTGKGSQLEQRCREVEGTLGKSLDSSEPQLPPVQNEANHNP